jgi:phosphohistidine phosphatase
VELYSIRHGLAVDRKVGIEDAERPLTEEGHRKTEKVAKRLQQLGIQFDLIQTSPLVRARQTAEILRFCGLSSQIEESVYLAPDGNSDVRAKLRNWLEQWKRADDGFKLAIVGHQPDLGQWAEILVWGDTRAGIILKKAGIIGLKLPSSMSVGCSQLFWLTSPKFLL